MSPATNNVKSSNKKEAENNINSSESRHVRRTRGASEIRATPEGRATRSLKRTNGQAQKTAPPNYWACKYNDPNIHTLAGGVLISLLFAPTTSASNLQPDRKYLLLVYGHSVHFVQH